MNLARLTDIIEAHGADPRRWPETERADAELLLSHSPEAALALARAASLDRSLDAFAPQPPLPRLADTIRARAARTAQPQPLGRILRDLFPSAPLMPQMAGLAVAATIGFAIGFGTVGTADAENMSDPDALLLGLISVEEILP